MILELIISILLAMAPQKVNKHFPPIVAPIIKRAAVDYDVNVDLICAIIHKESSGNPWASRFEPGFYDRYIKGKKATELPGFYPPLTAQTPQTENFNRAKSFGLMQIMGNTARLYGFDAIFLDQLFDMATNIDLGTKILSDLLKKHDGNLTNALLAWNGGGNKAYPGEIAEIIKSGKAHYLLAV